MYPDISPRASFYRNWTCFRSNTLSPDFISIHYTKYQLRTRSISTFSRECSHNIDFDPAGTDNKRDLFKAKIWDIGAYIIRQLALILKWLAALPEVAQDTNPL